MSTSLLIQKTYPASPLTETRTVNLPHPSSRNSALVESLSGPLDDYCISQSISGSRITAEAREPYQTRYRSTTKRLSAVEIELGAVKIELGAVKIAVGDCLRRVEKEKADRDLILLRSQIYNKLLLSKSGVRSTTTNSLANLIYTRFRSSLVPGTAKCPTAYGNQERQASQSLCQTGSEHHAACCLTQGGIGLRTPTYT